MYGKYVIFEGLDGCGKSTQAELLSNYLSQSLNVPNVLSKEPGSTLVPFNVRDLVLSHKDIDPMALELLFQADRAAHTAAIAKLVDAGTTVISDRSYISGLAYAKARRSYSYESLDWLLALSVRILPDIVFYLKIEPEEAIKRWDPERLSREEVKGVKHMTFVKNCFDAFFEIPSIHHQAKPRRVVVLDATKSVEEIHKEVVSSLVDL